MSLRPVFSYSNGNIGCFCDPFEPKYPLHSTVQNELGDQTSVSEHFLKVSVIEVPMPGEALNIHAFS